MTAGALYGLRGSRPTARIITADSREQAIAHRMPDDVIVVSVDGGQSWQEESEFLEAHPERGTA